MAPAKLTVATRRRSVDPDKQTMFEIPSAFTQLHTVQVYSYDPVSQLPHEAEKLSQFSCFRQWGKERR